MKVEGQCHCGAIAFEADVQPETFRLCHCMDCQILSGSPFRQNVSAPADSFRILRGEPRVYVKIGESGARRAQAFCASCGTPIYSAAAENTPAYNLRVGILKQRRELGRPAEEIWTKRRVSWLAPLEGATQSEGQRQDVQIPPGADR